MYLKRLEMQGFKSFADRTIFEFSPGVSAIVGPNGSGKSNVVDAIRWVLGEQSAKTLRGGKMEDVIFSGSGSRKPVGMAKVTLVMDNRQGLFPVDYHEVAVSRTLYRSGESLYELNKQAVRLKDIQELFMDTGLGRDGFSVIGQGKIDEILSLHAQERRGLLEEAAGISKYKYRKREAERRLTATDEDLSRLDDLLFELEERLEPLRLQAEEVARYEAIAGKEKTLATAWLSKQWQDLEKEQQMAAKEVASLTKALEQALAEHLKASQEEENLLSEQDALQRRAVEEEADVMHMLRLHEGIGKASSLMSERLRHVSEQRLNGLAALELLQERLQSAEEAFVRESARLEDERRFTEQLREEAKAAEHEAKAAEFSRQSDSEKVRAYAEEQFSLLREQAQVRNRQGAAEQEKGSLEERLKRLSETTAYLEWQAWEEAHRILLQAVAEQEEKETAATNIWQKQTALYQQTIKKEDALSTKVQTLERQLFAKESRLAALSELEAGGDGYFAGVQAVLRYRQQGTLDGIHGAVSQLLTIPPHLTIAMETALGGAAQHLVVENEGAAKAAIALLKKERKGRATFLPLTTVQGRSSSDLPQVSGVLGWAVDLVGFSPEYQGIMQHLLGHILVVETIDIALSLAKKEGFRRRYVTLDGDILAAGGAMTGGRLKKSNSVLQRAVEVKTLEEEIQTEKVALTKGQSSLKDLQVYLHTLQIKLQAAEEDHREAVWASESLRLQLATSDKDGERLSRSQRSEKEEISWAEQALLEVSKTLAETEAELSSLAERLAKVENEKKIIERGLADGDDQQAVLAQLWQEAGLRLARAETRLTEGERTLDRLKTNHLELQEAWHQQKQKVDHDTTLEVFRQGALERLKHRANVVYKDYMAMQEKREKNRQILQTVGEQLRQAGERERHTYHRKNEIEQVHHKEKNSLERIEQRLVSLNEEIATRFEVAPPVLATLVDASIDLDGAKERLAKYKRAMQAFGPLNFTAPQEYKDVSERTVFLREQIDDANEAKRRLLKLIHEMEKTMSERFRVTYQKVNALFRDIFKKMFEGGDARLELSMPANMLETGVEIIAQPPGKKERTLTLLSGGERAMTAIALLFALLEVRPSPFVILDEIEAALDGANVERFASFIDNYAEHTQFVVISHRQGTMEAADVLYGITMDGGGVSQLVSVRMDDYIDEGE